jgi:hypothetical protein
LRANWLNSGISQLSARATIMPYSTASLLTTGSVPGIPKRQRIDGGVGRGLYTVHHRAGAEHLALGQQLGVNFQADYGFSSRSYVPILCAVLILVDTMQDCTITRHEDTGKKLPPGQARWYLLPGYEHHPGERTLC